MTKSDSLDFVQYFRALWGNPPFAWQQELADRVSGPANSMAEWPDAIDLPTASGKTACVDIAVFALAKQASRMDRGEIITAPRRIFFVVDRRVIVDQAYERARDIAEKLRDAESGVLRTVADSLRKIAYGATSGHENEMPLRAYALRGGMFRSEAWARDPLQPTVIASTVDQVGSRLLFRAYGRGSGSWPIYAGLIANDSLILLDEAHCAQPFLQTLQAVRRYREWAHTPLERAFHPVVMSATPPRELSNVFVDRSDQRLDADHPLGRRQLASKTATLERVSRAKGRRATAELSKALADAALGLVDDRRRAIVVFANRVATARETFKLLRGREGVDAVILTGRMRPIDKDCIVEQHLQELQSERSEGRVLAKPMIVVATQTLEVGADLDFDGLVTECASLDALRQRFGRLNRMGRSIDSRAVVLIRADQAQLKKGEEGDPVYGTALTKTWDWLNENRDANGEVDFGIACLDRKLSAEESVEALNAPSLNAPVMLPAHVDCWAQTAPEPRPSPDVSLFLHGPRESVADVQVCWRADIDLTTQDGMVNALEVLRLCPPSSGESLPVPIGVFKRWLSGEQEEDDSSDVEGTERDTDHSGEGAPSEDRRIVRWRGSRDTRVEDAITADPRHIRPGDVLVIPTSHPGQPELLGDFPVNSNETAGGLDIGDLAHMKARATPILRLQRKLVEMWPEEVASVKKEVVKILEELEQRYEQDPNELADALGGLLKDLAEQLSADSWPYEAVGELVGQLRGTARRRACRVVGDNEVVIVGSRRIGRYMGEADTFSDEDDVSASGISHRRGGPVRLANHLRGVERFARRYAVGCGLPEELTEAVARAALLHDVGKADPRFQALLRGSKRWLDNEYLAKSGQIKRERVVASASAEDAYPQGGRHELLSVRMAENAQTLLPQDTGFRELVLHMIASHHGHCRPFAPVVDDKVSVSSEYELAGERLHWHGPTDLESLDSGVAERYWWLVRRYGWWGVAWLEGLLRLADWRRSEWEEICDANE